MLRLTPIAERDTIWDALLPPRARPGWGTSWTRLGRRSGRGR